MNNTAEKKFKKTYNCDNWVKFKKMFCGKL